LKIKKKHNLSGNTKSQVIEYLTWVSQFVEMPSSEREMIKNRVLESIKNSKAFEKGNYGKQLYDFLTSPDLVFIGVVPNTRYIKTKGPADELDAMFVHPHGGATLLFCHKRGGCLFTVNPMLRVNKSILHEIPGNKAGDQTGVSG